MKKQILYFLLFTSATAAFAGDFRGYSWGSSSAEVLENETTEPEYVSDEKIVYEGELDAVECFVEYYFYEDKLICGAYIFTSDYGSSNIMSEEFDRIENILNELYGKTINCDSSLIEKYCRTEKDTFGFYPRAGHVVMMKCRQNDNVTVSHFIYRRRMNLYHVVHYQEKDALFLMDAKRKEDLEKEL